MSEKETTPKRHQCSICQRCFARPEHLKRHTFTHTQQKPFRCFCGKAFGRRDLLKRHEQVGRHLMSGDQHPLSPESAADGVARSLGPQSSTQTSPAGRDGYNALDLPSGMLGEDDKLLDGWFTSDTFQNFDAFISSTMGLNNPFLYTPPDLENDQMPSTAVGHSHLTGSSWSSSDTDMGSVHELKRIPCLWAVTPKQWDNLNAALRPYDDVLSGFVLPSALALTRYITGYYEDFHNHQPILHTGTFRPQESPEYAGLVLAICACGALTRYERQSAMRLFRASKAVVDAQRSRERFSRGRVEGRSQIPSEHHNLRTAQAAMLLSTMAIMEVKSALIHEAASLNFVLVDYVRSHGGVISTKPGTPTEECWQDWGFEESARRTRCAIFNLLNLYTMTLDTASPLSPSQFNAFLPCSTSEWTANNRSDWQEARRMAPENPVSFQQAYTALFDASAPHTHLPSPMGNMVLINAILQRIYLARQLQIDNNNEALRTADLDEIEIALDRWTHAWKQAPESILDPRNPDASNSFTSTSYLGLAYVRLHTTYGARRRLCDWQPKQTGLSLHQASSTLRTSRIDVALLHVAQAFAIPVKYGIEYLSRKQFHHWDIQNFIWHLEAAVFLSKWFLNVAETCDYNPLSDFESRLMSVVNNLVEKAEESIDSDLLWSHPGVVRGLTTRDMAASLSHRIARLWACLYKRQNSPWGVVEVVGESLAEYASLTERDALARQ